MPPLTRSRPPRRTRRFDEPEQVTVDRLVRHIYADPVLERWLRGHVAGHLDAAATELEEIGRDPFAVAAVRRMATEHRAGGTR